MGIRKIVLGLGSVAVALGLLAGGGGRPAEAMLVTYDFTFTPDLGPAPSGFFTVDDTDFPSSGSATVPVGTFEITFGAAVWTPTDTLGPLDVVADPSDVISFSLLPISSDDTLPGATGQVLASLVAPGGYTTTGPLGSGAGSVTFARRLQEGPTGVPEPGSLLLLGAGLAGLAGLGWRRGRA